MMTTKDPELLCNALGVFSQTSAVEIAVAAWPLPEGSSTVIRGRELIRGSLTMLGLDEETVDNGVVIVSELVTNVLRHAKGPYELRLYRSGRTVVCEVVDGLETLPSLPCGEIAYLTLEEIDSTDDLTRLESGRGLDVVYRLSNGRCGTRPTKIRTSGSLAVGKGVWFALDLPERSEGQP